MPSLLWWLGVTLALIQPQTVHCEVSEDNGAMATLVEWIRADSGFVDDRVQLRARNGQRGLHVSRRVQAGEVILEIPLRAVINVEHAVTDATYGLALDAAHAVDEVHVLSAYIALNRRNEAFRWRPFIAMLPDSPPPQYSLDESSLAVLAGTTVLLELQQRDDKRKQAYDEIREQLRSTYGSKVEKLLSWTDFVWAESMVRSRIHMLPVIDHTHTHHPTMCMVPLADLLNMALHPEQSNVACKTNGAIGMDARFVCHATLDIEADDEMTTVYGSALASRSNPRLFLNYGFTLPSADSDAIMLKIKAVVDAVAAPVLPEVTAFLAAAQGYARNTALVVTGVSDVAGLTVLPAVDMLQYARLSVLQPTDFDTMPPQSLVAAVKSKSRISFGHETRAVALLRTALLRLVEKYPRLASDDGPMPCDSSTGSLPLVCHAHRLRRGELRVLRSLLDFYQDYAVRVSEPPSTTMDCRATSARDRELLDGLRQHWRRS